MNLNEPTLLREAALIGHVPKLGVAETREAIEMAATAQKEWAAHAGCVAM